MVRAALETRTTSGGDPEKPQNLKAADIPVFNNMSKFPEYWARLRFFMRGQTVSPNRCQEACFLILSRWEGPQLARYAQNIDAGTLARSDWTLTRENILVWLNREFRSKTDMAETNVHWLDVPARLRGKHYKSGLDFYLVFQTELNDYISACLRNERPQPTDAEITRHFVNSLPPAIAARVRETASDLDTQPYETYRNKIANVWEAHQVADIKINMIREEVSRATGKRSFSERDDQDGEVQAAQFQKGWAGARIQKGKCRESWDNAPNNLKGAIYPQDWMNATELRETQTRYERVKKAGVCSRCRGHKGGHVLDTFEPLEPFKIRPRVSEITLAEEDQEEFHDANEA
jgi:hypothetical protein